MPRLTVSFKVENGYDAVQSVHVGLSKVYELYNSILGCGLFLNGFNVQ